VLEVFPLVNLIGTVSLGVAALSYAGTFSITVVADADAYPDLDVFAGGVREVLQALAARSSTTVSSAAEPVLLRSATTESPR
jgi:diacylglycerol O-acyltransferase / wax synthase